VYVGGGIIRLKGSNEPLSLITLRTSIIETGVWFEASKVELSGQKEELFRFNSV
jgi:hypothetical protein